MNAMTPSSQSSSSSSANSNGSHGSKDELFWKILDSALKLDLAKGHLRWKMTDLSRESAVTRSLIYYYFGHSKGSILEAAVTITGEEFFGLSDARQALWKSGRIWESVQKTRQLVKATPHIPLFFLNQRQPGRPFYKAMLDLEKRHFQKLSQYFPKATPEALQLMYATLFGLCMVADVSDETLRGFLEGHLISLSGVREPITV